LHDMMTKHLNFWS